jgi:hypothetical protein
MHKYFIFFRKNIPYINFTISSIALIFQLTVINPLHSKLYKKIDNFIENNYIIQKRN